MHKIFVLSLHRSATQSVHDLFLRAGLSAIHWPPTGVDGVDYQQKIAGREDDLAFVTETLDPVFRTVDAASDLPVPVLYRELEARYPQARFLAVRRKPEDWVRSVRRHLGDRPLAPFAKVLYHRYLATHPDRLCDVSDGDLLEMHREHHRAISQHFAGKANFALFDLEEPQLGERICAFLGLEPIELPYVDGERGMPGVAQLESLKNSRSQLFRQLYKQTVNKLLGRGASVSTRPGERPEMVAQFESLMNSPARLFRQLCAQIVKKSFGGR